MERFRLAEEEKAELGWMPMVIVALVIGAAIGGIILMQEMNKVEINPDEISVTLIIDYGNGDVEWHNVTTTNNTLPGVLAASIGDDMFEMGRSMEGVAYLESINNVANNVTVQGIGDTASMWWSYSFDGFQAPVTNESFVAKDDIAIVHDGQEIDVNFIVADGPSGVFEQTGISVEVIINFGNGTYQNHTMITDNYTALGALEEAVGYDSLDMQDFGWGEFVNGIEGISPGSTVGGIDDTSAYYWIWYIDGEYGPVGAGQYVLQDGDSVEWVFETWTG